MLGKTPCRCRRQPERAAREMGWCGYPRCARGGRGFRPGRLLAERTGRRRRASAAGPRHL